jgi:hypothetical protein
VVLERVGLLQVAVVQQEHQALAQVVQVVLVIFTQVAQAQLVLVQVSVVVVVVVDS